MRVLVALLAIGVVGIIVVAAGTHVLADENSPKAAGGTTGSAAIGYADITVSVKWDVVGDCTIVDDKISGQCNLSPSGVVKRAPEHLNIPQAPATVFGFDVQTITTTCRSDLVLKISGPGFNGAVTASSDEKSFDSGQTISYPFGHVHFFSQGTFTVSIELYAYGCWGHNTRQLVNTVVRELYFDGENDF